MRAFLLSVSLVLVLGGKGAAQPSGSPADGRMAVPSQPEPEKPSDYLRIAQGALAAGYPDRAEDALEHAQTRLLDRSVPLFQTDNPSSNPISLKITQARRALVERNRSTCVQLIQAAIESATAQGL